MIPVPTKYFLVAGKSEGFMPLNAFDGALISSGVGNTNLLKMSSILPPAAKKIEPIKIPYGSLVPIAYASIVDQIPGEYIASAVACAVPEDDSLPGLIMEYSAKGHPDDIEGICQTMAKEGLKMRGYELKTVHSISIGHQVENTGACFAGVVLWY